MYLYAAKSGRSQTGDICKVEIIHEFKLDHCDSPFGDEPPGFEYRDKHGWDMLGQTTEYATAQMAAQFRTYVFLALISPRYARLLRWDRAGVVVTKAFSLKSRIIAEFYWRYCHASAEMRGRDVSVSTNLGSFDMDPVQIRQTLGLPFDCRLYQLSLEPGHDGYVFGTPSTFMGAYSPTGRSTRVFKAICVQNNLIPDDDLTPIPDYVDDLESFYHVLTRIAYKIYPELLHRALAHPYADHDEDEDGVSLGGHGKYGDLKSGVYSDRAHFKNPPLKWLINNLRKVLTVRYCEFWE
ncbi:hypothetical protein AX17_004268 [Amanita inopinata Kibby_2008]|nr:hypothetical protein AX17_004268 [Amanita inopinata Kibby_2008]